MVAAGDLTLASVRVTGNLAGTALSSGGILVASGSLARGDRSVAQNSGFPSLLSASAIRGQPDTSVTLRSSTLSANSGGHGGPTHPIELLMTSAALAATGARSSRGRGQKPIGRARAS